MKYIRTPAADGKYTDASGNRCDLREVPPTAFARGPMVKEAATLEAALVAFGLVAYVAPAKPHVRTQLSKYTIMEKLKALDKWTAFKELMALPAMEDAKDGWDNTAIIYDDNELFTTYAPQFMAMLGLTDEQMHELIQP